MKKSIGVLGILIFLAVIFIYAFDDKEYQKISANEFLSLIENKEQAVIYYGQEDCSACRTFFAMLRNVSENESIKVLYLDSESLKQKDEEILEKYYIRETPTLIVVSNGTPYIYRNITNKEQMKNVILNTNIIEDRLNTIEIIDSDGLEKKLQAGLDFFLYIGRTDCRDCIKFYPILEQYVSEGSNRGLYYFDIKKYRDLTREEGVTRNDDYEKLRKKYDIEWVPSVYHIRSGIIVAKYQFLSETFYELDETEQKLQEQRYIEDFYNWMQREMMIK